MKLIVITQPHFIPKEAFLIRSMLDAGVDYVHIRKPEATSDDVIRLVDDIGQEYCNRLAIHYHHDVAMMRNAGGIHLSGRYPDVPPFWAGRVSKSCHSIEETQQSTCDYCFLSPIFDSISKQGYNSRFSIEDLKNASKTGFISNKTIALGGVTCDKISYLRSLNFGGIAVLGGIWNAANPLLAAQSYIEEVRR